MSRRTTRRTRTGRDAGYVIGLGALLLLPMLAFTGLAVDLGSWYARAAQIQRATDAASLGGVALLPLSEAQATNRALEVARQNGFIDGVDGIEVEVVPVGIDQLRVRITDNTVPQYFTTLFRDEVTISRASTAEYIPPVRMGSPRNFLGTGRAGQIPGGAPAAAAENFVLSINSPCSYLEDGDLLASVNMGFAPPGNSNWCNPSNGAPNPDYDARGYMYGVRVEEGYAGGNLVVEAYDPAYCSASIDLTLSGSGSNAFTDVWDTRFTLRQPSPNPYLGAQWGTPLLARPADCAAMRGQWVQLGVIPSPSPGDTWGIQVQSLNHTTTNRRGSANNFALRVRREGQAFVPCSTDPNDAQITYAPTTCANVFAFEHLSIFAQASGAAAEFFLASIGPEHSGKSMIVELFDPGEGGELIRLIEPSENQADPNYATFSRSIRRRFPAEAATPDGWGVIANQTSVDIRRTGPPPGPNRLTDERCGGTNPVWCMYNERSLRLEVQLPADINTAFNGLTWWKLRYDFAAGVNVTDRTTWSVSVRGDPVRLIE